MSGWPGISEPLEGAKLRVLSLGAGVQSSTLALMAARGEIGPMPDCAIFADTQWEPQGVYDWLAWLERQLPFPVYRVTAGSLRDAVMAVSRYSPIPVYIRDGERAGGQTNRACTRDYKLRPIRRKVRELLDLTRKRAGRIPIVEQWIGISTDEMQRMKISRDPWVSHRFPLVEERMNRNACLNWLAQRQYPLPAKSSCIGCPYHSGTEWRNIKADPISWSDALEVDAALRDPMIERAQRGKAFLHNSCLPLSEIDFSVPDTGQGNLFDNECEGMCGV